MKKVSIFLALILAIGILSGFSAFINNSALMIGELMPFSTYEFANGGVHTSGNTIRAYCNYASAHDSNGHALNRYAYAYIKNGNNVTGYDEAYFSGTYNGELIKTVYILNIAKITADWDVSITSGYPK